MENLVVEHKEALKNGIVNLLVTVVLAAVLIVAADQFVMSVGTAILIAALVFEALMAAAAFIREQFLLIFNIFCTLFTTNGKKWNIFFNFYR